VRLGDRHLSRHDQVEVDEGRPAGVPCPQVVRLEGPLGVLRDQRPDAGQDLGRDRLVHQPAAGLPHQAPARPEHVDRMAEITEVGVRCREVAAA
jgi:hypothetical protein